MSSAGVLFTCLAKSATMSRPALVSPRSIREMCFCEIPQAADNARWLRFASIRALRRLDPKTMRRELGTVILLAAGGLGFGGIVNG